MSGSESAPAGAPYGRSVKDVMQERVVTIRMDAPLRELVEVLRVHEIEECPVVDAASNVIGKVGVTDLLWLTDRWLRSAPGRLGHVSFLDEDLVRDIMTLDMLTVADDDDLQAVIDSFLQTGHRRAYVLDQGALAGVVSISDLLRMVGLEEKRAGPEGVGAAGEGTTDGLAPPPIVRARRRTSRFRRGWLREGLWSGLIAYLAGVIVYTLIDLGLRRTPFFAALTLGGDLFGGVLATAHPAVTIAAYEVVRLLVVLVVGLGVSAIVMLRLRRPRLIPLGLAIGIVALILSEGVLLLLARPVSAVHPWWSVLAANLVGGLCMSWYLINRLLASTLEDMAVRLL